MVSIGLILRPMYLHVHAPLIGLSCKPAYCHRRGPNLLQQLSFYAVSCLPYEHMRQRTLYPYHRKIAGILSSTPQCSVHFLSLGFMPLLA